MYERATVLLRRDAAQAAQIRVLGFSLRQVERRAAADRWWNGLVDSASSDGTPIASSIAPRSAGPGPMCLD